MILAIDIGNTITHLAVYDGNKMVHKRKVRSLSLLNEKMVQAAAGKFAGRVSQAGISSVVTKANSVWGRLIARHFSVEPLFVSCKVRLPISLNIKSPEKLGADRICNAVAGYVYFKGKENVIAVDFGTAITYDVVLKSGTYLGGIISPGIETMAKSLNYYTSRLPRMKSADLAMPKKVIGKSTVEAIRSGTVYSAIASFEGITGKIQKELGRKFKIILTGGFGALIHSSCEIKTVLRENLVLEGIRYILGYNED